MCGIAGWFSNDAKGYPSEEVDRMLQMQKHRGPNSEGKYFDSHFAVGHKRLSIIDLSNGDQPILSSDRRYCLSFNGQIYNYVEIRERLKKRGYVFRTSSDSEVLLNLLIEGGIDALNQTNGMFAFAFWDSHKQVLMLARDRFGVKPLYLCKGRETWSFSSELKALRSLPGFDAAIDRSAIIDYLSLGYIRSPQTIFASVSKIVPGCAVFISLEGCKYQRWYKRSALLSANDFVGDFTEHIHDLLQDSIRLRLRGDVPIGSLLSGGIDSSAVTAMTAQSYPHRLKTYSVGFGGKNDELPYSRILAKRYQTDHQELIVDHAFALSKLPLIAWHLDEPNGDSAALPTFAVSEFAAQEVSVVLSGIGGDELFGGYTRYYDGTLPEHLYRLLPQKVRTNLLQPIIKFVNPTLGFRALMNDQPNLMRHFWHSGVFAGESLRMITGGETLPKPYYVPPGLCHPADVPNNFMAADIEAYLPDDILSLTDRMSMANSLEVREPLLDHRLVELCYQIPSNRKLDPLMRRTKLIFREALKGLIPNPILSLQKQGFGCPISSWLSKIECPLARVLNDGHLAKSGLVDSKGLKRYLSQGASYDRYQRPTRLWTLLMLEIWIQIFLDNAGEMPRYSLSDMLD
jgi:asparagine synthase (glutamine-hydrolysing)